MPVSDIDIYDEIIDFSPICQNDPERVDEEGFDVVGLDEGRRRVGEAEIEEILCEHLQKNIDEAKQLLAEAGYKDCIETEMSILAEHAWMVSLGQVLKAQLKPAGITLNMKPATMDAWWGMWDEDVMTLTWWSHRRPWASISSRSSCAPAYRGTPSAGATRSSTTR